MYMSELDFEPNHLMPELKLFMAMLYSSYYTGCLAMGQDIFMSWRKQSLTTMTLAYAIL